jgi:hypothetical protein
MSEFLGPGVYDTLSPEARNFLTVIFQRGKPPLDMELNLISQIQEDLRRATLTAQMPSGFVGDPLSAKADYTVSPQASNMFWLGQNRDATASETIWAHVNGWMVPVTGTLSTDARSAITLPPPQASSTDSDVNFVFLEVWTARLQATGTQHKPSEDTVWKYGNVEFGGTNVAQDFVASVIGVETAQREQVQYRIRVVSGVNPALNPYGFNPALKAQGPLADPTTSVNTAYSYTNMGSVLGDPGLWRAGDGDGKNGLMGTVDGYVYAIPMAMVFRRASQSWSILNPSGAINRFPTAASRADARVLPEIKLTSAVDANVLTLQVDTTQASTTLNAGGGFLLLGGEVVAYTDYTSNTITLSERGAKGTREQNHAVDTVVDFVSGHPLNLFSDQIIARDILDLRHMVTFGGTDYTSLLQANFSALASNELHTSWKKSSAGEKGTRHFQVDYLGASSPAPDFTEKGDSPDGFRKVFSDAVALQPNNLIVLGTNGTNESSTDFEMNPGVTIYRQDSAAALDWNSGDVVEVSLDQYRNTFATVDDNKVRFVHPFEYDNVAHAPVSVWYGKLDPESPNADLRSPYTVTSADADPDFVVLGEAAAITAASSGQTDITFINTVTTTLGAAGTGSSVDVGVNFDADIDSLVAQGAYLLLISGTDPTSTRPENHGAFRILGTNSGVLVVETAAGIVPIFNTTGTTNRAWKILLPACSELDPAMYVCLTSARTAVTGTSLYLTYDLLYHPCRGLARVPEMQLRVDLDAGSPGSYVRENDFDNIASSPTATVKRSRPVVMSAYPHQHHKVMQTRNPQTLEGVETVWGDAYVDAGSKTLVYQPLRNIQLRLDPQPVPSARSYSDVTGLFNLNSGADSLLVPSEVRGALGRQDLPFVESLATVASTSTSPAYGLNHLFLSGSSEVNKGFVQQRMVALYDPAFTSLSDFGTYPDLSGINGGPGGVSALVCRYYNEGGVRGIEIPAHYGVARLFAVYTQDDFYSVSPGVSNFADTVATPFRTDGGVGRTNLLRTDGERRSLIITENNTFVIPEDVIDQSGLSASLEDTAFVLEFASFFFDDWTQDHMRVHRLATADPVGQNFQLFVHGPALAGDQVFVVSTRTPYQGGIFGTMPISTSNTSSVELRDYVPKRDTENPAQILELNTPFESPELARISNPGVVEIVATLPFATTQGTGIIAGPVVAGSYTDVGHLSLQNFPFQAITDEARRVRARAHVTRDDVPEATRRSGDLLGGLTERLPLGLLVSDYQFMGEMLGAQGARTWGPAVGADLASDTRQDQKLSKAWSNGVMLCSDGTSAGSAAFTGYDPNFNLYRTQRGGVCATISGINPGGAVLYTGGRLTKDTSYVATQPHERAIHGAALLGVACLVRTTPQSVTDAEIGVNYGETLQLVVMTGLTPGKDLDLTTGSLTKEFIDLVLEMHPTGLGEGRCAADRYHLQGRPLVRGGKTLPSASDVPLATPRDPSPTVVNPLCP